MNFQPDCPMERGGLAVCCVMERNSFSHGLRRASSLSEGASGEEVKRFGFAKGPISEGGCRRRRLGEFTLQMDKSFHLRHFGEKAAGGFDFLTVFM